MGVESGPISRCAVTSYVAAVSHQSKLTTSSSIQDRHQLKSVELNIVLWYIYILKLDLIILGPQSFHRGSPSLHSHTSLPFIKIKMGHKGRASVNAELDSGAEQPGGEIWQNFEN